MGLISTPRLLLQPAGEDAVFEAFCRAQRSDPTLTFQRYLERQAAAGPAEAGVAAPGALALPGSAGPIPSDFKSQYAEIHAAIAKGDLSKLNPLVIEQFVENTAMVMETILKHQLPFERRYVTAQEAAAFLENASLPRLSATVDTIENTSHRIRQALIRETGLQFQQATDESILNVFKEAGTRYRQIQHNRATYGSAYAPTTPKNRTRTRTTGAHQAPMKRTTLWGRMADALKKIGIRK